MLKFPSPFQASIFVCNKKRESGDPRSCCSARGGEQLRLRLKQMVQERGLEGRIRVFQSGCLGVCEQGPAAMSFPGGDLLMGIKPEDLPEVLDQLEGR